MESGYGIGTLAVHSGQEPQQWNHGAVIPPVCLSTTFYQPYPAQPIKYEYSRSGNPTRECLETALAALEGAKYGLTFSSGSATQVTIIQSLVKAGEHVICCEDCYGGTGEQFRTAFKNMGIETTFVDGTDVASFANAVIPGRTRVVWVESPTNPTLNLTDLKAVHDAIKNIDKSIVLVVDNTFMSSVLQRPIKFGADIVMHSMSKYMNGHSDVVMGCLVTSNDEIYNKLKSNQNTLGTIPSPFDCFLVNRGIKTLHLRMERHSVNALAVAKFLETHPKVRSVIYPGLASHPQHELAVKQSEGKGLSGMVSFYVNSSDPFAGCKLASAMKVITSAASLGGTESLVSIPSLMSHVNHPPDFKKKLGIDNSLLRLSIGLEDATDLIEDLKQALDNVQ